MIDGMATKTERLDELLAMAQDAGARSRDCARAEAVHENSPRGRKRETYEMLRRARRERDAAFGLLRRARLRFLSDDNLTEGN